MNPQKNYYGSLCAEMYEILHEKAPLDELEFYLSYARKGQNILEPLCGSGRFLAPFLEKGFAVTGIDNSAEMLEKLRLKAPGAVTVHSDIEQFRSDSLFDYIFISSGSVSLFTDMQQCRAILKNMRGLLKNGARFVFAVDTTECRPEEDKDYKITAAVKTKEGYDLILKSKNHYDESARTLFSPGIYELYDNGRLLRRETMDFQTHLYEPGEMENILREIGFSQISVYSSFDKKPAAGCRTEMFLYECVR